MAGYGGDGWWVGSNNTFSVGFAHHSWSGKFDLLEVVVESVPLRVFQDVDQQEIVNNLWGALEFDGWDSADTKLQAFIFF